MYVTYLQAFARCSGGAWDNFSSASLGVEMNLIFETSGACRSSMRQQQRRCNRSTKENERQPPALLPRLMSSNVFDGAVEVNDTRCHCERPGVAATGWNFYLAHIKASLSQSLAIAAIVTISKFVDSGCEGAMVSHPGRKNKNAARVGHPGSVGRALKTFDRRFDGRGRRLLRLNGRSGNGLRRVVFCCFGLALPVWVCAGWTGVAAACTAVLGAGLSGT
jgi:hypothetical protein